MSTGHHHHSGIGSAEVDTALSNPAVKANLAKPYTIDRSYDLPYLAGYSKDGATIYIDRHMPQTIKIGARNIDPTPFLQTHEHVEKSVIDGLGYKYAAAHEVATAAERRKVVANGINWRAYSDALEPYIKADQREGLERIPPDLDLTPYLGETKLLECMRAAQGVAA